MLVPPTSMTRTPMPRAVTGFPTCPPNWYRIALMLSVPGSGRSFEVMMPLALLRPAGARPT